MKITSFNELNDSVICWYLCFLSHQFTLIIINSMDSFEPEKQMITVNRTQEPYRNRNILLKIA